MKCLYNVSSQDERSVDRIPVRATFSLPVETAPVAHADSYTKGTGSFPGLTRSERGIDHPLPSTEVKERLELQFYSLSLSLSLCACMAGYRGKFTFYFIVNLSLCTCWRNMVEWMSVCLHTFLISAPECGLLPVSCFGSFTALDVSSIRRVATRRCYSTAAVNYSSRSVVPRVFSAASKRSVDTSL